MAEDDDVAVVAAAEIMAVDVVVEEADLTTALEIFPMISQLKEKSYILIRLIPLKNIIPSPILKRMNCEKPEVGITMNLFLLQ